MATYKNLVEYSTADGAKYLAYIPEGCNSSTCITIYNDVNYGGGNEFANSFGYIDKSINQDTNSIVLIPIETIYGGTSQGGLDDYASNLDNILTDVASKTGVDKANTVSFGFSAGGAFALNDCAKQIQSNGVSDINAVFVFESDPGGSYSADTIKTLAENNTTVFYFCGNKTSYDSQMTNLANNGVNVIRVKYLNTDIHGVGGVDTIENGIINFMSGGELSNMDAYEFYKYDGTNWVKMTTEEIEQALIDSGVRGSKGFESIDPTTLTDGTIASDLYTVYNSMSGITQSVTENANASKGSVNLTYGDKTASIPGDLLSAQQGIMSIGTGVLGNLGQEAALIQAAADQIYQLDTDLASAASTLDNGSDYASNMNTILDSVINININTDITIPTFLFNATGNTTENVGVLCMADINSMYSGGKLTGALAENFNTERENANAIKGQISDFQSTIGEGKTLCGEMWDTISQKLDTYDDLMDERIKSMDKLETAYTEALKLLSDYMEGYDELDPGDLPELETELQNMKDKLAYSKVVVSATRAVVDEDGKVTGWEYVYSVAARASAQAYINYANEQIPIIEAHIEKLNGLPEIISEAEQIINDALVEIYGSYGVKASNVVTGKEGQYIPPENTNYVSNRISESEFNENAEMLDKYGTYENYKNHKIVHLAEYDDDYVVNSSRLSEGVLTEEGFNNSFFPKLLNGGSYEKYLSKKNETIKSFEDFSNDTKLTDTYANYQDYLNGVSKTNASTGSQELDAQYDLSIPEGGVQDANTYTKNGHIGGTTFDEPEVDTGLDTTPVVEDNTETAPVTEEPTTTEPTTTTPVNSTGGYSNGQYTGSSGGGGSSGSTGNSGSSSEGVETETKSDPVEEKIEDTATDTETKTDDTTTTEIETNTDTNTNTNIQTEAKTDADTQTEVTTDTNNQVDVKTNAETKTNKIPVNRTSSSKSSTTIPSYKEEVTTNNDTVDEIVEEVKPVEEIIEEAPIIEQTEEATESVIENVVEPVVEDIQPIEPAVTNTEAATASSTSTLKTLGIIAGAGAAVGAASFGAHTVMKNKQNDESSYYEEDEAKEEGSY